MAQRDAYVPVFAPAVDARSVVVWRNLRQLAVLDLIREGEVGPVAAVPDETLQLAWGK